MSFNVKFGDSLNKMKTEIKNYLEIYFFSFERD